MAIIETWDSQKWNVSVDGATVTAKYKCTWDEWELGGFLPIIGAQWSPQFPDLFCTNITAEPEPSAPAEWAIIVATFSTSGFKHRRQRTNDIKSWSERLSVSSVEEKTPMYRDVRNVTVEERDAGTNWQVNYYNWAAAWRNKYPSVYDIDENGATTTRASKDSDAPDHFAYYPKSNFSVTTYGDIKYLKRVWSALNAVNNVPFLQPYFNKVLSAKADSDGNNVWDADTESFNDTGIWRLSDVDFAPVRDNCMKYEWTFETNGDPISIKWNEPHGVETGEFYTMDFMTLFEGMDFDAPDDNFERNEAGNFG